MESALRHVVGGAVMDLVITEGREQIAVDVQGRLQSYLNTYETGITVSRVNIDDSHPPQQVVDAFDDVTRAKEDKVRLQNEAEAYANSIVPEARGRAQRMIEEANAVGVGQQHCPRGAGAGPADDRGSHGVSRAGGGAVPGPGGALRRPVCRVQQRARGDAPAALSGCGPGRAVWHVEGHGVRRGQQQPAVSAAGSTGAGEWRKPEQAPLRQ